MSERPPNPINVRFSAETLQNIEETARRVKLSKNDVIKLAVDKGLPLLEKALGLTGEELSRLPEGCAA